MEPSRAMSGLDQLIQELSEHFEDSQVPTISHLSNQQDLPLEQLLGMNLQDLQDSVDLTQRTNLFLLYHARAARAALSASNYTLEVSSQFLESIKAIKLHRQDFMPTLSNDLQTAAIRISFTISSCSTLDSANTCYAHMKEIKDLNPSLDTIDELLTGCVGTYYILLDKATNIDMENFPSTFEKLASCLKGLVGMDELGIDFDYSFYKDSTALTTIALIDNEGITSESKYQALSSIKKLSIDNQCIRDYLDKHFVEESKDYYYYMNENIRKLNNNKTVKLVKLILERKQGAWIYKGRMEDIEVCVKEVKGNDPSKTKKLENEARIFQELTSNDMEHFSYLPKFYGVYNIENHAYGMAFELCRETLSEELVNKSQQPGNLQEKTYTSEELSEIARALMRGLIDIHRRNYCHGDIKTTNLMRAMNGDIKIIDFDASIKINENGNPTEDLKKVTDDYLAPELCNCDLRDQKILEQLDLRQADVFSAGITLLHLYYLNDTKVYNTEVRDDLLAAIEEIEYLWLRNLLRGALNANPKDRISCKSAISMMHEQQSEILSAPISN